MTFRLRPEAESDIEAIAAHIADDSPAAASRWLAEIESRCLRLADMPHIGVARADLRPGLRLIPAGRYLLLYRVEDGIVEIVRVVDGARQWQNLLRD